MSEDLAKLVCKIFEELKALVVLQERAVQAGCTMRTQCISAVHSQLA